MKIYFKDLYGKDDFKLLKDEVIDLNDTIFKIVCENNIKEVIAGDEKFNCYETNEIEFIKLRTSLKDKIEFKVIENVKDRREKIHKKIIKVLENSFIYNNIELDKIRYLGELAYKNITSGLSDGQNDYYDNIINNLFSDLVDIDEIYGALVKVIKLANDIAKNPKVDLIQTEEVRDSNEVKRISSNSARYFIMHPEDWFKEGDSAPKPIKLLTDTFEENKDIYENQIIKFILYKCRKIIKSKITLLKASESTLKTSKIKYESIIYNDDGYRNIDIEEYENKLKELDKTVLTLKKFKALDIEVNKVYELFHDITLNKRIKFMMTQKILYDKRYLRTIQLFKKFLRTIDSSTEEIFESKYPIVYSYMFIISEIICKSLQSLGFYEINSNTSYSNNVFKEGKVIIQGCHYNDDRNFKFELELNKLSSNDNLLKLELKYKEQREVILISINSLFSYKKVNEEEIDDMYLKFSLMNEADTHLIVNTISLDEIKFISEEVKNKLIFKLSNLGNNFIKEKDYDNYGGFKVGMIPLGLNDLPNMFDKLLNLMYLKFIKMGFYGYCKSCGSGELRFVEEGLLGCSICTQKIAINRCKFCGEKMIKILSRETESTTDIHENDIEDIIEKHKNYELRSNTLGACYENYKSNSGGFCSKCGKCQKTANNCLRCSLMN